MTLEKKVERYLCQKVKELGGIAEKFTSPNRRAVPDRIVLLPQGVIYFVECKSTGKKPTLLQERDHMKRKQLGQKVFVVQSFRDVDALFS